MTSPWIKGIWGKSAILNDTRGVEVLRRHIKALQSTFDKRYHLRWQFLLQEVTELFSSFRNFAFPPQLLLTNKRKTPRQTTFLQHRSQLIKRVFLITASIYLIDLQLIFFSGQNSTVESPKTVKYSSSEIKHRIQC